MFGRLACEPNFPLLPALVPGADSSPANSAVMKKKKGPKLALGALIFCSVVETAGIEPALPYVFTRGSDCMLSFRSHFDAGHQ